MSDWQVPVSLQGSPPKQTPAAWDSFLTALDGNGACGRRAAEHLESALQGSLLDGWRWDVPTSGYQRLPIYFDPRGRFSVLALVWAPGSVSPVHAHRVWCALGVCQGELQETEFIIGPQEQLEVAGERKLASGETSFDDSSGQEFHRISNAGAAAAVSIHIYGIAREHVGDGINRLFHARP